MFGVFQWRPVECYRHGPLSIITRTSTSITFGQESSSLILESTLIMIIYVLGELCFKVYIFTCFCICAKWTVLYHGGAQADVSKSNADMELNRRSPGSWQPVTGRGN